jgi:hypothetical protein
MSGLGPFNPNQIIYNNAEFTALDVTGDSTGVDVMTGGTAVVVDSTVAEIVGNTYPTIQGAVNYFQGKTCSACTITVAEGTYVENLVVSGVNVGGDTEDLQILGDVRPIAGMTYAHSAYAIANLQGTITPATYPLATYGAGAITLSQTGANDVTVTCAGTAVDFALAGVVAGDTCYIINNAGTWTLYTILTAVGAVVTMTIPIVGITTAAGTSITFLPNRKIIPTTVPSTAALIESNVTFKGFQTSFAAAGANRYGLRVSHAKIHLDNFVALMCGAGIYADSESCINLDDYTAAASISILNSTVAGYIEKSTVRLTTPVFMDNGGNSFDMVNSNVILTSPVIFLSNLLNRLGNNVQMSGGFMYLIAAFDGVIIQTGSNFHDIGSTFDMVNDSTPHTAITVSNGGSFTSDGAIATNITRALVGIAAVGGATVDAPLLVYDTVTDAFTWDGSCSLRIMDPAGAAGYLMTPTVATSTIVHHIVGHEISSVITAGTGAAEYLTAQFTGGGPTADLEDGEAFVDLIPTALCKGGRLDLAFEVSVATDAGNLDTAVGSASAGAGSATLAGTDMDIINSGTTVAIAASAVTIAEARIPTTNTVIAASDTIYLNIAKNWVAAGITLDSKGSITLNWTIIK